MHGGLLYITFCLSVCLSVRLSLDKKSDWTIIHISQSIAHRDMKFGHSMEVDDPKVDLRGQGHRSKSNVTKVTQSTAFWTPRTLYTTGENHSRLYSKRQVGSLQRQVAFLSYTINSVVKEGVIKVPFRFICALNTSNSNVTYLFFNGAVLSEKRS